MHWFLKALKNYANFEGRARRKEYWYFHLFFSLFYVIIEVLGDIDPSYYLILIGYYIFMLLPGLAVSVRRLHDIGKSGWRFFIILIPLIGALILFIDMLRKGDIGDNKYGPDPKEN